MSTITNPITLPSERELNQAIGQDQTAVVVETFRPYVPAVEQLLERCGTARVTDVGDVAGMERCGELAKECKRIRCEIASKHKGLKESSLRFCQELDRILRTFKEAIEPVEDRLTKAANFAREEQAKARQRLRLDRQAALYNENFRIPAGIILEDLEPAEWDHLLTRAKAEKAENDQRSRESQARIDAERAARAAQPTPAPAPFRAAVVTPAASTFTPAPAPAQVRPVPPAEPTAPPKTDADRLRDYLEQLGRIDIPAMQTQQGQAAAEAVASNVKKLLGYIEVKAASLEGGASNGS